MSSGGIFILVLLVLFLVWLMLVRPQRRRQLNQQLMIDHLRVGDEVLTAGGFFATVVRIDEDEVTVELSPGARGPAVQAGDRRRDAGRGRGRARRTGDRGFRAGRGKPALS